MRRCTWRFRAASLLTFALTALSTGVAVAAEGGSRTLETPADMTKVVAVTLLGLGGLAIVSTLVYLYRRERNLRWRYQFPDPMEVEPAPEEHESH